MHNCSDPTGCYFWTTSAIKGSLHCTSGTRKSRARAFVGLRTIENTTAAPDEAAVIEKNNAMRQPDQFSGAFA
jgi:hypothetical protein